MVHLFRKMRCDFPKGDFSLLFLLTILLSNPRALPRSRRTVGLLATAKHLDRNATSIATAIYARELAKLADEDERNSFNARARFFFPSFLPPLLLLATRQQLGTII